MSDINPIPELTRRFGSVQEHTEEINREMFELIHENQRLNSEEHKDQMVRSIIAKNEQQIKSLRIERGRSEAKENELRQEYFKTLRQRRH